MAKRLSLRKRIVFTVFMICIPFLFLEFAVRTYFSFQVGPRVMLYGTPWSRYQAEFDPKGAGAREAEEESTVAFHDNVVANYSKYYPNQRLIDKDEFGNTVDVTINSRGFRGNDFESAKSSGVIRVVTLGASSTFGFRNHDEETYPVFLEAMLNEALPEINRRRIADDRIERFEVINLGIPHLRSEEIYSLFVNEALDLDPDFVTFYEGINDAAWLEPPSTSTEKTKQAVKAIPFANEIFRALRYRLLAVALVGNLISPASQVTDVPAFLDGKSEHFVQNLQRILDECRRNGIHFIVAGQQATSREGRGATREDIRGVTYETEQAFVRQKLETTGSLLNVEAFFLAHGELMEAEREWALDNDVYYADVIGAMNDDRQYLVTWVHLNSKGNQVVASVLRDAILTTMEDISAP